MFPRISRNSKIFGFLFIFVVFLNFRFPNPAVHITKTVQFEHKDGPLGDQLFSLFSHLGVAQTLDRVPVLNVFENAELVARLSQFSSRFPMLLEQFMIVIEPEVRSNAELGMNHFEDPVEKLSAYTTSHMVVRGNGFQSFKYFHHLKPLIRQWMIGDAEHVERSRNWLPENLRGTFKICVHGSDTGSRMPNSKFIAVALERLLLKFYSQEKKSITVVMGDISEEHGHRILDHSRLSNFTVEKVYLDEWLPEEKLTFSHLYCDAVLLTDPRSNIGWWMGYLAKKERAVFYLDNSVQVVRRDFFPPEWKRMHLKRITEKTASALY